MRSRDLLLMNLHYRLGSPRLPYPPLLVNLEPTNFCNLRCPMCPVGENHDNPAVARGLMDWGLFEQTAARLGRFKPEVALNLGGESTVHPRLAEMVVALKHYELFVFLDTNAAVLGEDKARALLSSGLDEIVVCLDGYDEKSYEAIRQRARYARTVANIRGLLRIRAGSTTSTPTRAPRVILKNIRYSNDPGPDDHEARLRTLIGEQQPDEYRFTWPDYWPGVHASQAAAIYEKEPVQEHYAKCVNLWKMMAISWDGMVHICCLDLNRTTPIGRIQDYDLMQLWNHPKFQELRSMHAQSRQSALPLCGTCNQIRRQPTRRHHGLIKTRETRFTRWNATERSSNAGE